MLPKGYELKTIPSVANHWFVDGACGYRVATGKTQQEAIDNAVVKIEEARQQNSKPAWYFTIYQ